MHQLKSKDAPFNHPTANKKPAAAKVSKSKDAPINHPTAANKKPEAAKVSKSKTKADSTTTMPRPSKETPPKKQVVAKKQAAKVSQSKSKLKASSLRTTRKKIFLTVLNKEQKQCIQNEHNNYRLFGTVTSGRGKDGYNISLMIFLPDIKW